MRHQRHMPPPRSQRLHYLFKQRHQLGSKFKYISLGRAGILHITAVTPGPQYRGCLSFDLSVTWIWITKMGIKDRVNSASSGLLLLVHLWESTRGLGQGSLSLDLSGCLVQHGCWNFVFPEDKCPSFRANLIPPPH